MIELELAAHYEALAPESVEGYEKIKAALQSAPLYHQWRTYKEKGAADFLSRRGMLLA